MLKKKSKKYKRNKKNTMMINLKLKRNLILAIKFYITMQLRKNNGVKN
jgi:hypothetical protein